MDAKFPPIRKAVFPVAGLGSRFLPATKSSPKEMLSVVNKPLIQYAVEEAYESGIRQMIFVTCYNKRAIEDHFDLSYQLERELQLAHKDELLAAVQSIKPADMVCCYIRQSQPLGLGDAILCAQPIVGNEAFAVLLADDLIIHKTPAIQQLAEQYREYGSSILAVHEVPTEYIHRYGIIQGTVAKERLINVQYVVEKPEPEDAPSDIAIVGRYIFTPAIFQEIRALPKIEHKELQLTDAILTLIQREHVYGYFYRGRHYDCGNVLGFLKANVVLGKTHPTEGKKFEKWLASYMDAMRR